MKDKMKRILTSLLKYIMVILITMILTFFLIERKEYKNNKEEEKSFTKKMQDVIDEASASDKININTKILQQFIEKYYIGEIDEEECLESALKGYVEGLGDPYSNFLTRAEYEEFVILAEGNYSGIGISMGQDKEGKTIIVGIFRNSPAEKSGITPGDIILKIDGEDALDLDLEEVSYKIKGKENTKVKLELLRKEEIVTLDIKREKVEVSLIESEILQGNIGYIKIYSFDDTTTDKVKEILEDFKEKNIKSLILDLRDNGGGVVEPSINIADLFVLKEKSIMQISNKSKKEKTIVATDIEKYNWPMVILVNEQTASASEIVVGALKDNKLATIVGQTTFGKGVVQSLIKVADIGYIKLTIEEFFTPKGDTINKVGIEPDYIVENMENDETDYQLEKAISLLKNKE